MASTHLPGDNDPTKQERTIPKSRRNGCARRQASHTTNGTLPLDAMRSNPTEERLSVRCQDSTVTCDSHHLRYPLPIRCQAKNARKPARGDGFHRAVPQSLLPSHVFLAHMTGARTEGIGRHVATSARGCEPSPYFKVRPLVAKRNEKNDGKIRIPRAEAGPSGSGRATVSACGA